ncbi:unnamed protein product [Onchocerca ochengi]|uniref:2-aminoethanethiol dioxygenase n=1 Tax=Onchocerca ochengi TaxID=42157 RepID=A0A182EA61_ONCOC|nr:unnamed protein product [Onchocerca ochengi]
MSQQGLRSFLRETSAISERLAQLKKLSINITDSDDDVYAVEKEMLTERARQLVSTLTLDMLGAVLPDRLGLESMTAPIYYADIYETEHIHACLFGFKSCDFLFPLHDHPDMYGFLKVLRGGLSINSYTKLSRDEQEALKGIKSDALSSNVTIAKTVVEQLLWELLSEYLQKTDSSPKSEPYISFRGSSFPDFQFVASCLVDLALFTCQSEHFGGKHVIALTGNMFTLLFEGISNRWHSDDCVYLGPKFSNIHSLTPLENGAAFFDLLMPGYRDKPCTYFKNIMQNPKLKQACLLQKIAEPEDYYCQVLPYEKIKTL